LKAVPGNTNQRGKLSTLDLLAQNWFGSAVFDIESIIYFLTKRATLMRRSTVLNLPLQLAIPGSSLENLAFVFNPFESFHFRESNSTAETYQPIKNYFLGHQL